MPIVNSPSNRLLAVAAEEGATPKLRHVRAKRYGGKFSSGFLAFYSSSEMADCTVVGPDGREYHLHGLLLAYHSEFFRQALSSDFKEGQTKRIALRFQDAGEVWPALIEYFYTEEILLTDSNVLALFAASRELLIPAIQDYCADFAQNSLEASNAIQFLSQAVQYNCDQFRASCVTLVAQSFNTCCFKPTDGLPVEVIMEILEHPQLYVQTEEQVLHFVTNYVTRHELDDRTVRMLFGAVRLPFLSNERLASLTAMAPPAATRGGAGDPRVGDGGGGGAAATVASPSGRCHYGPPSDLLLTAMAQRLMMLDHPDRLPPPTGGTATTGGAAGGGGGGGSAASSGAARGGGSSGYDGRCSPSGPSHSSVGSGDSSTPNSGSGSGGAGSGNSGGSGNGGGQPRRLRGLEAMMAGLVSVAPRKTYCCSVEYGLPGGSEYVTVPMEQVWEDLAANLTVRVSGDKVEGDCDSILRTTDDSASWFTVTGDDPGRPVWVELAFPPHMRVIELTKYTFSHGMNMIAHMFPYGISDSSWFQMKGMSTQVSLDDDDGGFTTLRTQDSCSQHTEFVVTVDPACTKQVVWRRMRILAGEDSAEQVRLSIRKLKLYGKVEVSLMREPEGRDVVAAWRRRKEAAASGSGGRTITMLRGMSAKRLDLF